MFSVCAGHIATEMKIFMSRIDMHIHSVYSDGLLTPIQIVEYMRNNGVHTISITDHNTLNAYKTDLSRLGIRVIPGVEIDVELPLGIQFLCYGFGICKTELNDELNRLKAAKMKANLNLAKKLLRMKIDVFANSNYSVVFNDFKSICSFLLNQGLASDKETLIREFFSPGKLLFENIKNVDPLFCIRQIHNTGGIVVLAHPGRIHDDFNRLEPILKTLIAMELDGIECYHPDNSEKLTIELVNYCKNNSLLITGGSDMHGSITDFFLEDHQLFLGEL